MGGVFKTPWAAPGDPESKPQAVASRMFAPHMEEVFQPGSAFTKCEPNQVSCTNNTSYTTPPFSCLALQERTPSKRLRCDHRAQHAAIERIQREASPRLQFAIPSVRPQRPSTTQPLAFTRSEAPVGGELFEHIRFRDAPPGVEPEDGIAWIDTARVYRAGDLTKDWSMGSTPEMPPESIPWCGTFASTIGASTPEMPA